MIYHPPNPIYDTESLLSSLQCDIEHINTQTPGPRIILGGDLNKLLPSDIVARTDLISIVTAPTRGDSHLDHILVSDVLFKNIEVIKPISKSDHMAILAYTGDEKINRSKERRICTYRKKSPALHANFLHCLADLDSDYFKLSKSDVQSAADEFYLKAIDLLNRYYPEKRITLTSSEPNFITPELKADLRRKNVLMRRVKQRRLLH